MTLYKHADLCLTDVLHGEVEPDSEAGVAGVRPDEQVKLKVTDVVNPAKVPCRGNETVHISRSEHSASLTSDSFCLFSSKVRHQ